MHIILTLFLTFWAFFTENTAPKNWSGEIEIFKIIMVIVIDRRLTNRKTDKFFNNSFSFFDASTTGKKWVERHTTISESTRLSFDFFEPCVYLRLNIV